MHRPYAKLSRLPAALPNHVNEMLYDQQEKAGQEREKKTKQSVTDENSEPVCDKFDLK